MAAGITVITVESDQVEAHVRGLVEAERLQNVEAARKLAEYFDRLASGMEVGRINVAVEDNDGTAATGTITCTVANSDTGDNVTVCGVVFTVATAADEETGDFLEGASDNAMATNLGAAINAHPKLKGLLTAGVATNVVTCTMATKGVVGNMGTLVTSDATAMAVSAARFASGAVGTDKSTIRGFARGKV